MPLTGHHLRPRSQHARLRSGGFSLAELSAVLMVCRQCHNAVHEHIDEATLASSYYTADLLLAPRPNVGVVRIRMPVDAAPHPRNLITKLAGYAQVIDVENSVTVIDDLVAAMSALVAKRGTGVFHVTNPGTMRHRDLLARYRELVDASHRCELIEEHELVARGLALAPRSNCILASSRLEALGIQLRPIDVALADVMARYAEAKRAR
jgi:hypothetical protein